MVSFKFIKYFYLFRNQVLVLNRKPQNKLWSHGLQPSKANVMSASTYAFSECCSCRGANTFLSACTHCTEEGYGEVDQDSHHSWTALGCNINYFRAFFLLPFYLFFPFRLLGQRCYKGHCSVQLMIIVQLNRTLACCIVLLSRCSIYLKLISHSVSNIYVSGVVCLP